MIAVKSWSLHGIKSLFTWYKKERNINLLRTTTLQLIIPLHGMKSLFTWYMKGRNINLLRTTTVQLIILVNELEQVLLFESEISGNVDVHIVINAMCLLSAPPNTIGWVFSPLESQWVQKRWARRCHGCALGEKRMVSFVCKGCGYA